MLILGLLLAAALPDPAARQAIEQASTPPGAHARLDKWEAPRGCAGQLSVQPIDASGRVPVRVRGQACEAWGWATVTLLFDAAVLTRDVRAGESLEGAFEVRPVELRRGHELLGAVPAGSLAERPLKAGQPVEASQVRVGPPTGSSVLVRVVAQGLFIEQRGTISPCRGLQVCATLPSGKRVAGELVDGVLVAQAGVTP